MTSNPCVGEKTRVLIIDDTRSIRSLIASELKRSGDIEVVGEAGDPVEAKALIRKLKPHVLTLDVEMPRMNGLDFLERLMRHRPMPVIMISTRTTENSRDAVRALSIGAIDCVDASRLREGTANVDLANLIKIAANSNIRQFTESRARPQGDSGTFLWNRKSVLIGSSTGGVDALLTVIGEYPADGPPTLIAQHMPASFLESFSQRLDKYSNPKVMLAEDGMKMQQGHVYLAPGGNQHAVLSSRDHLQVRLRPHDGAERYVPSVNLIFSSAEIHANRCVGVMLTGMGHDGAKALLRMKQAGAHTIVQDAASSVVDGMPRSARKIGAASEVASLKQIGNRILQSTSRQKQESD